MAEKVFKCAYKHCQHSSCDIPQGEAVKVGNRYMHKDCAEKSEYILKTRDLYYEKVSNTVVMKQLVNVLNGLVSNKKIDPKFMYFALDYAIANKIPIRSPYGLHYLIDNNKVKEAWNKKKATEIARQIREEVEETEPTTPLVSNSFKYSTDKTVGFGGIFGGK